MKRYGDLFARITNIDNLYLAYRRARKGKTWQRTVKAFDKGADRSLEVIRDSLLDKTFHTAPYRTKIIHEPKRREIFILPFAPDRIVQHALMNILEPIWESFFIHDSYSCRVGKGIHAGSRRTMEFVRRNRYCLQCDVEKFYVSVRHDILYDIVQRKIKCKDTLDLVRDIIYSTEGGNNIPIGNYTSQWFGNLYLNELDQYLKHEHRVRDYIRYCDDFLVFDNDKTRLHDIEQAIEGFLGTKLQLRLSKSSVFPVSRGVDFLGYRHFRGYILLRKSTAKRVKKRLRRLPMMLKAGRITSEQFRSSLASTMGWLKWANTYNLSLSLEVRRLQGLLNAV